MKIQMTLEEARKHLELDEEAGQVTAVQPSREYVDFWPKHRDAQLEGYYTPDQLEALAVYMRSTQ